MRPAILCESLSKTYPSRPPVEAVRGIDLRVEAGECFGLLGPNGAGKTTTIEILEGLLAPSAGRVEILGSQWEGGADELKQRVGIALQQTELAEKLTVLETLRLFASFYRRSMPPEAAVALVALEEKAGTFVGKLSGGQKQRLSVACALVGEPELLFMDEPTTGLDPQSRRQLWDIIREFRRRGGTVLLTTHYMDEAERLCDRVAVVDQGKVIALGTPQALIAGLGGEHVIELATVEAFEPEHWLAVQGVSSALVEGDSFRLTASEPHVTLPDLLAHVERSSATLTRLQTRHASLEDVFVSLTGRHLRDDANG